MLPVEVVERARLLGARAVLKWSVAGQLVQLSEEAAELAVAAIHLKRDRIEVEQAVEELADVLVVALGVLRFLDPMIERRLVAVITAKLDQLEARLDRGQP